MDPHMLPLRSHPVVPGIDFEEPPYQLRDYVQPPPEKGPPRPSYHRLRVENTFERLPEIPQPTAPYGEEEIYGRSMENYGYTQPRPHVNTTPAWSTAGIPPWSTATRPLSDIRELTEPSLVDITNYKPAPDHGQGGLLRKFSLSRKPSRKAQHTPSKAEHYGDNRGRSSPVLSPSSQADRSSIYSIPPGSVPPRSSSVQQRGRSKSRSRAPSVPNHPPRGQGNTIPNRGHSRSPVKEAAARLDPITSDLTRRVPSRTFMRTPQPNDILEFPTHRHPRVNVELQVGASLFVGGGSVEGNVRIVIDDAERVRHKRALALATISVDLLGVEEMSGNKRSLFLNLATELIDAEHPPPYNMVESLKQISPIDPFWLLTPSNTSLPFMLSLPLDVGPPPFQSKHAKIRYMLCATLLIRDSGWQYLVRTSQDVSVLSVYDPEKALMSLPSPLTASDEWIRPREGGVEIIRVTAGLHRQVWVSGTSIFVDVHISNHSRKTIKKLEITLERDILCYKYAAASTLEKSASQARIFDSNERSMLSKSTLKHGTNGWTGVAAHSTDIRICDLEIPRGHATVKCGKYFEVRYFLNIIASSTHTKFVTVQLPIVLIHMNSLDVVPNSVAQVAAAIEEKRSAAHPLSRDTHDPHSHLTRRPSQSIPGRAFAAPRMQSLNRLRAEADDLHHIGHILDNSPRKLVRESSGKYRIRRAQSNLNPEHHTPPSYRKGRLIREGDAEAIQRRLRHVRSHESTRTTAAQSVRLGLATTTAAATARKGSVRRRAGSAGGFRVAEVMGEGDGGEAIGRDEEGGAGNRSSNGGSIRSRIEAGRRRQFEFKKKKSTERWKGPSSWWGESAREKKERKEMMDNWI